MSLSLNSSITMVTTFQKVIFLKSTQSLHVPVNNFQFHQLLQFKGNPIRQRSQKTYRNYYIILRNFLKQPAFLPPEVTLQNSINP